MSSTSWQEAIRTLHSRTPQKVAIVGIGHELRGDDAAGLHVIRRLKHKTDRLIIEGGSAPENQTGALRRFRPQVVILIDAAHMNLPPGTIHILDVNATEGFSASSHTLPLNLLAGYLSAELNCDILLFGIQPGSTEYGETLTEPVARAVDDLSNVLESLL